MCCMDIKMKIFKIIYAVLFITMLSATCAIIPDKSGLEFDRQNIDCTGLLASDYGNYYR